MGNEKHVVLEESLIDRGILTLIEERNYIEARDLVQEEIKSLDQALAYYAEMKKGCLELTVMIDKLENSQGEVTVREVFSKN